MAVDVVRDAKSLPQNSPDPDVKIPESVRRAAAAAEAIHKQAYTTEEPVEPAQDAAPVEDKPVNIIEEPVKEPDPHIAKKIKAQAKSEASPPPEPATEAPPSAPPPEPVDESQWEHRYRSMKGRYDASQAVIGQMQEQMTMLGNELSRTQHLMMQGTQQAPKPATLVTDADKQAYGDDLIDLTRRAALDAVQPTLNALEQENQRLQKEFKTQRQMGVVQALDADVPTWREINKDPRFISWLSLPDIYSGVVRKKMLDAAYEAASAPRVLAFFKGFVQDEVATGNIEPPAAVQQQPAPRQAATSLERLAAPGKARPAGGVPPAPASDTPIFTRAQIAKFYENVRKGAYAGKDAQRQADEMAIFSAQNSGRVR